MPPTQVEPEMISRPFPTGPQALGLCPREDLACDGVTSPGGSEGEQRAAVPSSKFAGRTPPTAPRRAAQPRGHRGPSETCRVYCFLSPLMLLPPPPESGPPLQTQSPPCAHADLHADIGLTKGELCSGRTWVLTQEVRGGPRRPPTFAVRTLQHGQPRGHSEQEGLWQKQVRHLTG